MFCFVFIIIILTEYASTKTDCYQGNSLLSFSQLALLTIFSVVLFVLDVDTKRPSSIQAAGTWKYLLQNIHKKTTDKI